MTRTQFDQELEERLIRYCKIDTQADEKSPTSPSTAIQFDLLNLLVEELKEIGAQEVTLTDYGAVLATIPATVATSAPPSAFWRTWTRAGFHASGVKPIVHRAYDGGDIVLPDDPTQVLSPKQSPYLAHKIGDDIVTASGTTLLGADDKAGVAIVMACGAPSAGAPGDPHGTLRIGFTPDEEIGRGVHKPTCPPTWAPPSPTRSTAPNWARSSTRPSRRTRRRCASRAFRRTPATPRTSWSTRCTWPPRSSTRCRTSR
jgi:tripeptide aminopeptidase